MFRPGCALSAELANRCAEHGITYVVKPAHPSVLDRLFRPAPPVISAVPLPEFLSTSRPEYRRAMGLLLDGDAVAEGGSDGRRDEEQRVLDAVGGG